MNHELAASLDAYSAKRATRGLEIQPPCSVPDIEAMKIASLDRLGQVPSEEYLEFLRLTNGIDDGGFTVYAAAKSADVASRVHGIEAMIEGFVDANADLRLDLEDFCDVLIFGQTELYYFVQDLRRGLFGKLPREKVPGQYEAVYKSFQQMMNAAIIRYLVDPE